MRLDRLVTLYVSRPLRAVAGVERTGALPVLMYHSISDTVETTAPYYQVCTSPAVFAEQMAYLADNGFRTLDLPDAQKALAANEDLSKSVVITFDDGFHDFYTEAAPILGRHGFTAVMYLPTAYIGDRRGRLMGRDCMTWAEVKELREAGMTFGSHSVNHLKLVELEWPKIKTELVDSKAAIEDRLGEEIDAFAYPYAFPQVNLNFATRFRELLVSSGYRSCVTTEVGSVRRGDDALRWKRLPANSSDDSSLLGAKLTGAYDWLAQPQAIWKRAKAYKRGN